MGIVIHYRGRLADPASRGALLARAAASAEGLGWRVEPVDEPHAAYSRSVPAEDPDDDEETEHVGPLVGFRAWPHEGCDPFHLVFDADGVVQDYCKTQFAPLEVHLDVVAWMRSLQPDLVWEDVADEGEAWPDGDRAALERERADYALMLADHQANYPSTRIGVRMPDGRYVDAWADDEEGEEGLASGFDAHTGLLSIGPVRLDAPGWTWVPNPGGPVTLVQGELDDPFQLSVYVSDEGDLPPDYALDLLRRIFGPDVVGAPVTCGTMRGLRIVGAVPTEVEGETLPATAWALAEGPVGLLATMIAAQDVLAARATEVDAVLRTLRTEGT